MENPVLNKNLFLVKEHVGLFKAANNYDIYDPSTGEIILECREPNLGFFTKMFRFSDYKRMTPFDIQISTPEGQTLIKIQRGVSLFLSKVVVKDEADKLIGSFEQKLFSIGGAFEVLGSRHESLCKLEGKWTGWEFYFKNDGKDLAHVSKKWNGLGKELFTTADNYMLEIFEHVPENDEVRKLILAAVMCIDMVLKE
ncbi:MAG: phospholipid scramblase-related protein [Spirochaetales bacterium]|nr:phospholipid scramblase-related protein [Spirochaetales bacterium]